MNRKEELHKELEEIQRQEKEDDANLAQISSIGDGYFFKFNTEYFYWNSGEEEVHSISYSPDNFQMRDGRIREQSYTWFRPFSSLFSSKWDAKEQGIVYYQSQIEEIKNKIKKLQNA